MAGRGVREYQCYHCYINYIVWPCISHAAGNGSTRCAGQLKLVCRLLGSAVHPRLWSLLYVGSAEGSPRHPSSGCQKRSAGHPIPRVINPHHSCYVCAVQNLGW